MGDERYAEKVREHLRQFGLATKEAERLGDPLGVCVLGLRVDGVFNWTCDRPLPACSPSPLTRRQLHSWIGELVGHFLVAGWLRIACGYLQRCTAEEKLGWDDEIGDWTRAKVKDVTAMLLHQGDSVHGSWPVDKWQPAVLWADASSLAVSVALQIEDAIVEDCAWLRKPDDTAHINMSELDAVIRGINLCLKWGVSCFTVRTDSATVLVG